MDINGFKAKLKSGELGGVYILGGEEDYLVRYYLSALRDAAGIDPAFAVFNNPVFDGEEVDFAQIMEAVNEKHGLATEAAAMICSLGIDQIAKLG